MTYNCIMCGCHETSACYHIEGGPCRWYSRPGIIWPQFGLCTHCMNPDYWGKTDPPQNKKVVCFPPLTKDIFKRFLGLIVKHEKISIESDPKDKTVWIITQHVENKRLNDLILKLFKTTIKDRYKNKIIVDSETLIMRARHE